MMKRCDDRRYTNNSNKTQTYMRTRHKRNKEKRPTVHHNTHHKYYKNTRYQETDEPMPKLPANEQAIEIYKWMVDDGLENNQLTELIFKPLVQNDLNMAAAGIKIIMDRNPSEKIQGYLKEIWYVISEELADKLM